MARGLGELVVRLGLDASDYVRGLDRAEKDAQRFARRIGAQIDDAARVAGAGLLVMSAAAVAAFAAIDQLAKQAANFKDLEEKTGANAEALASFSVAAQVAGTNIAGVAEATIKLTKNLTGVDDESKSAGAALAALNIPIKEFKELDPATQMETVAKALAGFEDGASKTAVALALFGKSGAEILPFLKELATGSGRVVILNQKLIEQADDYADKQARARAELNLFAQVAATQTLPAITALTTAAKDFIRELLGIDSTGKQLRDSNAIGDFANSVAKSFAFVVDAGDAVVRIFQVVGKAHAAQVAAAQELIKGNVSGAGAVLSEFKRDADEIIARQLFSAKLHKQLDEQARNSSLRGVEDRGFKPPGKALNFAGPQKDIAGLKERTNETDRYLESLERQVQGTLELSAVDTALVKIWELEKDALSGLSAEKRASILDNAQQIDDAKEMKKAAQEAVRQAEEEARIRERISRDATLNVQRLQKEAQSIRDGNQQIQQQIAFLKGGEEGLRAYNDAKLAKAILEARDAEATAANADASKETIDALHGITAALLETQAALGQLEIAKKFALEARNLQDVKNMFSDALVDPLTDFVTGTKSAKDAFKSFIDDLTRQLTRVASQNLANMIFGGTNASGPDWISVLSKFLGAFGGSSGGFSGSAGFGAGEGFAAGTNFAAGGAAIVGEHGPELVNLPRGAQVIPNHVLRQRRAERQSVMNFHINVLPGATTASVRQAKAQLRDAVMQATRDR